MTEQSSSEQIPKAHDPKLIEEKWYTFWEKGGFFQADSDSAKPAYCISIPPPNVTGVLHMGHALVDTLQDILIRWKRMSGYEALWVPGTDHAGIATQTVVERHLIATQNKRRKDFSREEFANHVWTWKEQSESQILGQLKKLGCSCDWSRLAFTMDPKRNRAVRTAFKKLFDQNLIYRGDYLVNWDPVTQTALADDEVEYEEKNGSLWFFRYPLEDKSGFVIIATTRPETMLGDTALAVSPQDDRYSDLVGKYVILPIMNRKIPIIADRHVDPTFGTGVVKITPAHDPNDYEMGISHQLPMINIMTPDGRINENGGPFAGITMEEARAAVVDEMHKLKLVEKVDPHRNRVGVSYRSKAIIEPYLSKQWFVRMSGFKDFLRRVVEEKKVRLIPSNWENTYFHWIDNLRDWCISRQLWWGHRIPIWYRKDDPDQMLCYEGEDLPPEVRNHPEAWEQDEDVLDTWFSSSLWPMSILGWPDKTPDLSKFYPNSTLITGHDILFFWVARMILMGESMMDTPPFPETFLHGLIYGKSYWRQNKDGSITYVSSQERAAFDLGQPIPDNVHSKWEKMSKSKGNIIDPLEIIDTYGTDAMRMCLCASATHARQIDLDRRRFEEFKNFINKIWNGARFVFMNIESLSAEEFAAGIDSNRLQLEDKWILSLLNKTIREVNKHLAEYAFDRVAMTAYDFFWKEFCAYYVELVKPVLFGKTGLPEDRVAKQKILSLVLCAVLRLMHPMAPFITEELFQMLKAKFQGAIPRVIQKLEFGKAGALDLDQALAGGEAAPVNTQVLRCRDQRQGCQQSQNQLLNHDGYKAGPGVDAYTAEALKALAAPACIVSTYPEVICAQDINPEIETTFALMDQIVYAIRNIRAEMQLPPNVATDLMIFAPIDVPERKIVENNLAIVKALVRLNNVELAETEKPQPLSASSLVGNIKLVIPLPQELRQKEKLRLHKEQEKLINQQNGMRQQLANNDFVAKAPPALVEKLKTNLQQSERELAEVMNKLRDLGK